MELTKENDLATVLTEGFVYAEQIQEKVIPYYLPKVSFLDWLFRRQRKIDIVFKVTDILLTTPKKGETKRNYFVGIK